MLRACRVALVLALTLAPPSVRAQEEPAPEPGMDSPVAADSGDIDVEIDLDGQTHAFWAEFPLGGDSPGVKLIAGTDPDCGGRALRVARNAITASSVQRAIGKVGKFYFKVAKIALKGMGLGTAGDAADLALRALQSNSASEFGEKLGEFLAGKAGSKLVKSDLVKGLGLPQGLAEEVVASEAAKALWKKMFGDGKRGYDETVNFPCPGTQVRFWIMGTGDGVRVAFVVNGDCECKVPENQPESVRLARFGVYGSALLVPHRSFENGKLKITFTHADAQYEVVAICGCPRIAMATDGAGAGAQTDRNIAFGETFVAFDTTEWCTYGGGSTGLPPGEPTTESPPGEPTGSGPKIGPPIPVPDGGGSFWPPTWATEHPKNEPPGTTPPPTTTTQRPPPSKPDEEKPKTPASGVPIKATQTVLEGGKSTAVAVAGTRVKLALGSDPELPLSGAPRVDEGFADPPLQAVTDASGKALIEVPPGTTLPASYSGRAVEVDSSPLSSKMVFLPSGVSPRSALDPKLHGFLGRAFQLQGSTVVPLFYKVADHSLVEAAVERSRQVQHVETNYCREEQETPNDPYYHSKGSWKQAYEDQWAIRRVGLTPGDDSAWSLLGADAKPVVVAVIDTGLDWNHADFPRENLWVNAREVPNNGKDDDRNGYVDDVIGWDFQGNDPKPFDRDGHGTFVAGVIAAGWNNGIGIAGMNPHARIMVLKALNDFGHTRASYLAEAITYAANNGARIINVSVGGKNLTRAEQLAVEYAHSKGALVVVAAGNEGIDVSGFGPAGVKGALAVAATDYDDKRASFSNWGAGIGLAAPGMDILGLRARRTDFMRDIPGVKYRPGEAFVGDDVRYYHTSGTSFSAPIVSGVASLLLSKRPELGPDELLNVLQQSAKDIEVPGQDQYTGFGLVDARAALAAQPGIALHTEISGVEVVTRDGKQLVQVSGTATADHLARRSLEIGSGETPSRWKRVGEATDAVENGVLGSMPAEELRGAKIWMIRSVVEHQNGTTREVRFRLDLE